MSSGDDPGLVEEHRPGVVARRLAEGPKHPQLRDAVYGAVDGAITTFAVAAGARGAGLSASIVLVLGLANLLADGFSMAASNYLGTRTLELQRQQIIADELRHIHHVPDGEREEIRQIFAAKGFAGDDLDRAVEVITQNQDRWVETMLVEEHGLAPTPSSPTRAALATMAAFVVVGALPLMPFIADVALDEQLDDPFALSAACTAVAFLAVGSLRGHLVGVPRARSAVETLALGGAAATLAYAVGSLLQGLV